MIHLGFWKSNRPENTEISECEECVFIFLNGENYNN